MPRVSVIVPAHNAADVIEAALASVAAQGFTDWEVIVGDDASTDGTAERVAALAPGAVVERSAVNGGPAAARNMALRRASGELVAFLDADDWWEPDYLQRQVALYDAESLRPGPAVGLVACDARIATAPGEFDERTYAQQFRKVLPLSVERLLRRNVIFISTLVPRSVGDEVGWFDEDLFGTEDHGLWLKIAERGLRLVYNPVPLAVYRRTEHSISHNVARQAVNNQRTLHGALRRGRLTPAQARVARAELRYNRALETIGGVAFGGTGVGAVVRQLPNLVWVVLTRPAHWIDWARALRGT